MAELADAHGSGPCGGNPVEVQVLLTAPVIMKNGFSAMLNPFFVILRVPMVAS